MIPRTALEDDVFAPENRQRKWRDERKVLAEREAERQGPSLVSQGKSQTSQGGGRFETQIAILDNESGGAVLHMVFHPFDPLLTVTDSRGTITVWN